MIYDFDVDEHSCVTFVQVQDLLSVDHCMAKANFYEVLAKDHYQFLD